MSRRVLGVIAAITLAAGPAWSQAIPNAPAESAKEKKLCRSIVPVGSIMAKKICLTKAEWARVNGEIGRHTDMALNARKTTMDRSMNE